MALINCPECEKEVSEKAANCPSCGFPLHEPNIQLSGSDTHEITCPTLPNDLSIGERIVRWSGDTAFSGEFRPEDNIIRTINLGGVKVYLHKFGINITNHSLLVYTSALEIHNTQIISIDFASQSDLLRQDKSVIGRAVVGSLLMGPLGTIVGGMSGIGTKSAAVNSFLVINYWDKFTKQAQTILIRGKDTEIGTFVGGWNTERSKIQTPQQQKAVQNLSASDKKILEVYKQEGLNSAVNIYLAENNIDTTKSNQAFNDAKKYVEGLAKSFGVQDEHSIKHSITIKKALKWVAGVILIVNGFGDLIQLAVLPCLFHTLAGIVCIPPLLKIIEQKTAKTFASWLKYTIVIICIIIGGIIRQETQKKNSDRIGKTSESSSYSSESGRSVYDKPSAANNETSNSNTQTVEYKKIGDQIEVGNFIYRVDGVKFRKQLGNDFINETADGVFLIVPISLKNISQESRTLDGSMFKLKDEQGAKYESSSRGTSALEMSGQKTLFLKQCQPNITTSGLLVFEVPSKGIYDLQLSGGFWSGKTAAVKLTE
jgi:Domain of unknown function (DUF4352)